MTELGTRLKEAREKKNISLDDLQRITKIQKRYLVGIEEGNYSVMPGKFYVRAFIKQYAEAVGLDPEEIFEEFKSEVPNTYKEELPEQLSRVSTKKQISPQGSKILDKVPMIIVTLFIIGGVVVFWWLQQNKELSKDQETEIENTQTEYDQSEEAPPKQEENKEDEEDIVADEEEEAPVEEEVVEDEPVQELVQTEKGTKTATYELKNTDKFNVELTATPDGKAWVDIQNAKGHKFLYSNVANGQKEQFDLSKETQVTFNIGFTPAIELKINGEVFEYPFAPNEKVSQKIKIIFTPTETTTE